LGEDNFTRIISNKLGRFFLMWSILFSTATVPQHKGGPRCKPYIYFLDIHFYGQS
jgi:hypothetical protein